MERFVLVQVGGARCVVLVELGIELLVILGAGTADVLEQVSGRSMKRTLQLVPVAVAVSPAGDVDGNTALAKRGGLDRRSSGRVAVGRYGRRRSEYPSAMSTTAEIGVQRRAGGA